MLNLLFFLHEILQFASKRTEASFKRMKAHKRSFYWNSEIREFINLHLFLIK